MMRLLFCFLLVTSSASAKEAAKRDKDFPKLKERLEKALLCRYQGSAQDMNAMAESVNCLKDNVSSKKSDFEQAQIALWMTTIKSIENLWSCDAKAHNLKSLPGYTPYFVCLEFTSLNMQHSMYALFFDRVNGEFKIAAAVDPQNPGSKASKPKTRTK